MKRCFKNNRNLKLVYSSRNIYGSSNLDIRLYESSAGRYAKSKFSLAARHTIEMLANQISFDSDVVDTTVLDPDIYVTISNYSLLNIDYPGDAYKVSLSVIVDYEKYTVDTSDKYYAPIKLSYSLLSDQFWIYDNGDYDHKGGSIARPTPESVLELLRIYRQYGDNGSSVKFFNDENSAERYCDSLRRKSSSKFGPISKKDIIEDAKEAMGHRPKLRYSFAGVYEYMSEISLDDLKNGNYSNDDRITFRVNITYNGNKSFVPVEYEYMNNEWSCITTNYDFSSEAVEILREINYPLDQ